jgi:hypothetical protein
MLKLVSYITLDFTQNRLKIIIGPLAKQCTGAHIYATTDKNKTVNVDKMKQMFIVLLLPTK